MRRASSYRRVLPARIRLHQVVMASLLLAGPACGSGRATAVSGGTYRDPGGWVVDVPQGWRAIPFHLSGPAPAGGVQISNVALLRPHAVSGVPLQTNAKDLPSDGIGIIIATDKGPGQQGDRVWTAPLTYDEFSQGSALPGSPTLDVLWFSGNGHTFIVTIKTGEDAFNDQNVRVVSSLIRSIRFT